jgi:Tol biopolymer transport system component
MPLSAGDKLGPYEILAPIGAGGMGEVYRARDTKLKRDVAIKVLPEAVARDRERMARFQREAEVLASLNHPNIAAIYGVEDRALVMELVEGASPKGPLPFDEAWKIATQIASALEYAHDKGIIHRDLKPANIMVTPEGVVKLLDFGLAKAFTNRGEARTSDSPEDSPTLTIGATEVGVILGTAAYMSPEQARGKQVDKRGDIWSFGVVLYELLTGDRLFKGDDTSDTLAQVLTKEPDLGRVPAKTRKLLGRCLEKDPRKRLRDIGDAVHLLEEAPSSTTARMGRRWVIPAAVASVLAATIAALVVWNLMRAPKPRTRPVARVLVTLPATDRLALELVGTEPLALSPDGALLVYVGRRAGVTQLFVRTLDSFDAKPIPGTEGAESAFFSPDGQSIGFVAGRQLKKVALSGGAPLFLSDVLTNRGASWSSDGTIIFTPTTNVGLFRISAAGGTPKPVTTPDRKKGEYGHLWPQILPGGKAVLFTIWTGVGGIDRARVAVLSLVTGKQTILADGGSYARYVSSGHIVYARAGGLLAVPFDLERLEATGSPVSILEGVEMDPNFGAAYFSTSAEGSLAYVPGGIVGGNSTLVWVDRRGAAQPLPAPPRGYDTPRLSPDGQQLAVGINGTNPGVWLYDLVRGTLTKLIEAGVISPYPLWSPDGKRITFKAPLGDPFNLYQIPADGTGAPEPLTTGETITWPGSWSPDGRVLAFVVFGPGPGNSGIRLLKLEGHRKPQPFLSQTVTAPGPVFSPDGHWLAYASNESGRREVYVAAYPGPGGKLQISVDGGGEPVWNRNGRELFYRGGDALAKMMAVDVTIQPAFSAGKPRVLFEGRYLTSAGSPADYDVSPDGQRFLMVKGSDEAPAQIDMVLNWSDELKRRAPAGK